VLGERWVLTGHIIAAYALIAAAKSLETPFTELTSVFGFQPLRLTVEVVSTVLVVAPIGLGAFERWDALTTIWVMCAAGAAGSLFGLTLVLSALRRKADAAASIEALGARP